MNLILISIVAATAILSYLAFDNRSLFEKYKFNVGAIKHRKEYLRLLTSAFLHIDLMHLLFNMLTLYFFAPMVIYAFGNLGFLAIYLGSVLLGNLFSLYVYQRDGWYSAVGASGGVSGVLFSAIAIYPMLGIRFFFIPIDIPGFIFGLGYFSYSAYMMLNPRQGDNIGHTAHLGGAFFGLLYAVAMRPSEALHNAYYLFIMSLPLLVLAYKIFIKGRR